jgi:hypothetical protein
MVRMYVRKGSSLNSNERESQDMSIVWLSYSQPEAFLPTASNIFLVVPRSPAAQVPAPTRHRHSTQGHHSRFQRIEHASCQMPLPSARSQKACSISPAYACSVVHVYAKYGLRPAGQQSSVNRLDRSSGLTLLRIVAERSI